MSGQEREMEEDEGEGTSDTALMLPRRPPDCQAAALRSPRWAGLAAQGLGILLLPGRALAGLLLHLLLPAAVFLLVLLPAAAIVFLGFLCHSRACQESGAETRATEEKVSPAGGTYRRASRSTPSLAPRAARCSRIAALRRSSCRASSRFLRFWCSPRPPAPAWPDASARCCRPRLAVLDPAATWCPATMGASDATLTGRSSSAPGCDPRNISKGPQDLKSQRPLNSPRVPHKVAPGWRLRVCVQVPTWEIAGPHAAPCAVLRVAARWHRPPPDRVGSSPASLRSCCFRSCGDWDPQGRREMVFREGRTARLWERRPSRFLPLWLPWAPVPSPRAASESPLSGQSAGLQRVPEVVRFAWETPRCMFPKLHRRPENQACRAQPENGISIYTPHVPSAESVMWLDQHGDDG
ncbi:transmembrane protein 88B isoform X2 [Camelus bactrianus]